MREAIIFGINNIIVKKKLGVTKSWTSQKAGRQPYNVQIIQVPQLHKRGGELDCIDIGHGRVAAAFDSLSR